MRDSPGNELLASLGRVRWATVGMLVACAVLSGLHTREASELSPALASIAAPIAIALSVGIIGARQIALRTQTPRAHCYALLATYLCCGALGVFGAFLAFSGDDGSRGSLFALGAAIFTLGSPPGFGRSA
jgi:hypothetical protein